MRNKWPIPSVTMESEWGVMAHIILNGYITLIHYFGLHSWLNVNKGTFRGTGRGRVITVKENNNFRGHNHPIERKHKEGSLQHSHRLPSPFLAGWFDWESCSAPNWNVKRLCLSCFIAISIGGRAQVVMCLHPFFVRFKTEVELPFKLVSWSCWSLNTQPPRTNFQFQGFSTVATLQYFENIADHHTTIGWQLAWLSLVDQRRSNSSNKCWLSEHGNQENKQSAFSQSKYCAH